MYSSDAIVFIARITLIEIDINLDLKVTVIQVYFFDVPKHISLHIGVFKKLLYYSDLGWLNFASVVDVAEFQKVQTIKRPPK